MKLTESRKYDYEDRPLSLSGDFYSYVFRYIIGTIGDQQVTSMAKSPFDIFYSILC